MFRRWISPHSIAALAALLTLVPLAPVPAAAQAPGEVDGAAALGLALRRLGTTKRVLMIGAHPDDENTAVLSELALGAGAAVAYLSLTRGEGGQNLIGPELEEPLGLIRTEELLAARRIDGARQFFTRAYDFGFSKSADEAFRQWPRDSLLADVVLVVRRFRPDILISVFSGTPRDGHGHHQAAGILAREAFAAAGDPARFPGQIQAGLRPHQPVAIYQALYRGEPEDAIALATGELDPLLGRSRYQIAMASRSRHRSQDMGRAEPLGPQRNLLILMEGAVGGQNGSIFASVDTTLSARARATGVPAASVASLERYEAEATAIRAAFNPFTAYDLAPRIASALGLLAQAESAMPASPAFADFRVHLAAERVDAAEALRQAAGLVFDATVDDARVVPGQTFEMAVTLWNGGTQDVTIASLAPRLPSGWSATPLDTGNASLAPASITTRRFAVRVSDDATLTEPYFLRAPRTGELYTWPADVAVRALPFEPPAVQAAASLTVAGQPLEIDGEATFSDVDKAVGERRRPVLVVPALAVLVQPRLLVIPVAANATNGAAIEARELTAVITSEAPDGTDALVRVEAPAGWRVEPAAAPVHFEKQGDTRTLPFRVTPPPGLAASTTVLHVIAEANGQRFARGIQIVDYPHTRIRTIVHAAAVEVDAFAVAIAPDLRIGWIEGAGDDAAEALHQLGATVEPLDAQALATADLSRYDAIVTGIRVYEVRPDLVAQNERLLDYARRGGVVIVQYNKYEFPEGNFAPYPLTMAQPHGRVTDETAAVRLLAPEHSALSWPNRIGPRDFEDWVQERGLYFADTWDERYVPLLEMADPDEPPQRGSLLVAPVGEGLYAYTGLALFRQIPEGVSGAYRLLANLVSMGKAPGR